MPDGTKVNPKYLEAYKESNPNAVEGKDYFLEGKTYDKPSSNNTSKQTSSGVTKAFKPFSYTTEEPIKTGSASSLDRMQAMVDNLNKSSSTVVNNTNISQFKEETKYETPDDENLTSSIKKSNQNVENQEMKERSRERYDDQHLQFSSGELIEDQHGSPITKKAAEERMDAWNFQGRMNVEKGYFSDGRRVNHLGQTPAAVDAENKRKAASNNSAIYNVTNDLTKSLTGDLVRRSKLGTWDGGPNVLGAIGKPLSWMGVDEQGVDIGEVGKQVLWHGPGTGEIMDAWELGKDVYKGMKTGKFGDAKLSLAALAAPFGSAGDVKKVYKGVNQFIKAPSKFTNITGNVNKFTKSTESFASQMSKKNPFKIGENLTLSAIEKAGFTDAVKTFKKSRGIYKRNKAQQASIKESNKNNKLTVNKENSGIIKPTG